MPTNAADYWEQARPADQYVASMQENRERFRENMRRTPITGEDRARFGQEPLRVLAITEEWCVDSVQFLAALMRLAEELPNIEVRVLERPQVRELAERYPRQDGYHAIPILILFEERQGALRELGALVERPARATAEIAAETHRFQQAHPELPGIRRTVNNMPPETQAAVKANSRAWRVGQFERWVPYLFDELAEIVARARETQGVA